MIVEYYRANIRHLVCTNVLAYARVCVFASVRYTESENNYMHGCTFMCQFAFATANKYIFQMI